MTSVDGIYRYVLVARISADECSALNGICTHEGCIVAQHARPLFVCPCHGSRYTATGAVVQGPAPASLPRFETELAGGELYIRL